MLVPISYAEIQKSRIFDSGNFLYFHVRFRKPHKALLGDNDIVIDALTAVRKAELHVGVFAFKL